MKLSSPINQASLSPKVQRQGVDFDPARVMSRNPAEMLQKTLDIFIPGLQKAGASAKQIAQIEHQITRLVDVHPTFPADLDSLANYEVPVAEGRGNNLEVTVGLKSFDDVASQLSSEDDYAKNLDALEQRIDETAQNIRDRFELSNPKALRGGGFGETTFRKGESSEFVLKAHEGISSEIPTDNPNEALSTFKALNEFLHSWKA
jgi:hypothetical protein